jgi:cytochrome c556
MESASADSAAATETETPQPAPASTTPAPEKPTESATTETAAADSWDALIPVAVLDEEIKNIRNFLQETVSSVGNYNSSMMMIPPKVATLAALAEVAHLQGQSVSWKDDAIYIRDLAGKMNSSPLQRGAKDQKRLQELFESIADILNRSKPAGLEAPPETDSFAETAEMRSLMKRMEEAEKLMKTEVGSADALTAKKAFVQHEAAVLGVLAKIVTQPGYGYEDDAEFKGFASGIVAATQSLQDAAEGGDFSGFEAAMSGIATNCQNCHSKYKND